MKRCMTLSIILLLSVGVALCACDRPPARPIIKPGAALLSFERSGGIAGFQDKLVIGQDGEYYLTRVGQPERIGSLSAETRLQLEDWQVRFGPFSLTLEDNPGGPDNLTRRLVWTGKGKIVPSQAEQHVVLDWASSLLDELSAVKK